MVDEHPEIQGNAPGRPPASEDGPVVLDLMHFILICVIAAGWLFLVANPFSDLLVEQRAARFILPIAYVIAGSLAYDAIMRSRVTSTDDARSWAARLILRDAWRLLYFSLIVLWPAHYVSKSVRRFIRRKRRAA